MNSPALTPARQRQAGIRFTHPGGMEGWVDHGDRLHANIHRVPEKKQATFIFNITSPSVEIFLQFLMHLVQD